MVRRTLAAAVLAAAAPGCSAKTEPSCATVNASCAPLYAPTFDNVFARTLQPTCAAGGGSCHAAGAGQGGLTYDSADHAYAELLGKAGGAARVNPGDAACSALVERIESSDGAFQMPPGAPLVPGERCTIEQWIAQGAKR